MGIPRLRHLLEPYAEQVELCGRDIVIDGPGLAYHILYQCQRQAASLFDLPPYSVLGQTAIRWLDELSKSGAKISAIYFDGFLPSTKEPERKKRLMDLSKNLRSYFSRHPLHVPRGTSQVPTSSSSFSAAAGPSKRLPTPSFLVPAVLEALCQSETYAPVTHLVPGEADVFCARHVRSTGGVIITSDSDLLVHDLGRIGSVAFLMDVEFKVRTGTPIASVAEYSIPNICGRLSLPKDEGMCRLAFDVSLNPCLSLNQAIQQARGERSRGSLASEYAAFMTQYLSAETAGHTLKPFPGGPLDPRVSELVLKFVSSSWSPGSAAISHEARQGGSSIPMYLPFLVDSPARTSAWETSMSLRQLAYGVTQQLTTGSLSGVVEFRRLQSLPGGTHVEVPPASSLDKLCAELNTIISKIQSCILTPQMRWVALAFYLNIVVSQTREKGGILGLDMLRAEAEGTLDTTSWDFIHLYAEVEGTYYSLRMLRQLCGLVSAQGSPPGCLSQLEHEIESLSITSDFPSLRAFAAYFPMLKIWLNLPEFALSLDLDDEVSSMIGRIMTTEKKEKKKKGLREALQRSKTMHKTRQSSNPFECLGE